MFFHKALINLFLILSATNSWSRPIDCNKKLSFSENVTCHSAVNIKIDKDIDLLFTNASKTSLFFPKIKNDQIRWLKLLGACKTKECVTIELKKRRLILLDEADDFVGYMNINSNLSHSIVVGTKESEVEYIKFWSVNKKGSDCNFVFQNNNGVLTSEEGFKINLKKTGISSIVDFEFSNKLKLEDAYCGRYAVMPKRLIIDKNTVAPVY